MALFASTQGCLQLPLWLCQGWILLGWSWGAAQSGRCCWAPSLPACWGCPCPAWVVVLAAACLHKGDLFLCEQQSSQLSQECDPGCHAAGKGHGLGPCQPAAAPSGWCVWAGTAQCPPACDTHRPGKVLGAQVLLLTVYSTSVGPPWGCPNSPLGHGLTVPSLELCAMEIWGKAGLSAGEGGWGVSVQSLGAVEQP